MATTHHPAGSTPPRSDGVVLRLQLAPGEGVSGSVASGGDGELGESVAFHGWMDLMLAIETLRRSAGGLGS